jgi:hypothetical protein
MIGHGSTFDDFGGIVMFESERVLGGTAFVRDFIDFWKGGFHKCVAGILKGDSSGFHSSPGKRSFCLIVLVLVLVVFVVVPNRFRDLAHTNRTDDDNDNEHEHDWEPPRYTRKQRQPFEKGIGRANIPGRRKRLLSRQQSAWVSGLPLYLSNYFQNIFKEC